MDPRSLKASFLDEFFGPLEEETIDVQEGVAIVEIDGPLVARDSFWIDSHEAIERRIVTALGRDDVQAIVLRIDSPGGHIARLFDAVLNVRAEAKRTGKPVYAFADEFAASAGYAWATAASHIALARSGMVGSIGVISTLYEESRLLDRMGLTVKPIASGDRKTDGHPALPLDPEAIKLSQERVDRLALQFAELVSDARPGLSAQQILDLEAGLFDGQAAVDAGLANEVTTLSALVARAKNDAAKAAARRKKTMSFSTIAAVLGIDTNATEADVIGSVKKLERRAEKAESANAALMSELEERTGKKTLGEALAVLDAKIEAADEAENLQAKLADQKKTQDRKQVEQALDAAANAGKKFNRDKALGHYDKFGMEAFESYLDASGLRVEQEDEARADEPTHAKSSVKLEEMSPDQRAAYRKEHGEDAYQAVRQDWERRGRPKTTKAH